MLHLMDSLINCDSQLGLYWLEYKICCLKSTKRSGTKIIFTVVSSLPEICKVGVGER